jgi:adenylosuccinate synthase
VRAIAVIGANFGDEGKGLLTDALAARDPDRTVVVRFNGGAQAGHTVVTTAGRRHVFHHFGAGSLAGARTFLSRHFLVNPFLWDKERRELPDLNLPLAVDRRAMLTTPFDMLVNREAERFRGDRRHGSCGLGINETVERCAGLLATTVADVEHPARLRDRLAAIANRSLSRLEQLGVPPSPFFLDMLQSESLVASYLDLCEQFRRTERLVDGPELLRLFEHVIFEGAQGLLLDERHRFFPHVTRSRTGLPNVVQIAGEIGLRELDVVYVTRTYLTRHGAGPFPTERPGLAFPDPTNAPNEWQGALRFGDLDTGLMAESIANDLSATGGLAVSPCLAVTCLDQVPEADPAAIAEACGLRLGYVSRGPSRDRVAVPGSRSAPWGQWRIP